MKRLVKLEAFKTSDKVDIIAQKRVQARLNGQLARYAKLDLSDDDGTLVELREVVGSDPDAIEEISCNGTLRALRAAVGRGSDIAAELLVTYSDWIDADHTISSTVLLDDESRPRPYWVHFGDSGSILLRFIRPSQHRGLGKRANFEVGFTLWGASLVLSRFIINRELDFANKTVLELGSGLGLCGLSAAKFGACKHVVLTDFHHSVVDNCRFNIELNGLPSSRCSAAMLDWEAPPDGEHALSSEFDVVIGSDVVCQLEDCQNIVNMLDRHVGYNGTAVICLGSADSRYGVAEFPKVLQHSGYDVTLHSTIPGDLSSWVGSSSENLDLLVGYARSYTIYVIRPKTAGVAQRLTTVQQH